MDLLGFGGEAVEKRRRTEQGLFQFEAFRVEAVLLPPRCSGW
jgi:hypothetical protein